MELVYLDQYDQ